MKTRIIVGAAFFVMGSWILGPEAHADMTRSTAERLMASGKSMTCDYKSQNEMANHEGTVYVSKGKMRGDYKVLDASSGPFNGHMIQDGSGWAYMWGGPMGENRGTKIRLDGHTNGPDQKPEGQGFDARQEMDMDCREWKVDESKFEVPSNVQFMDLSQMMGGGFAAMAGAGTAHRSARGTPAGNTQAESAQAMKCQICEQVPDEESRAQCRQMMGC